MTRRSIPDRALVRVGGSVLILTLLLVFLPVDEMVSAFRRVPLLVWPAAIVSYLAVHVIGVAKWRMLVNVAGAGLALSPSVRAYYWGLFGNTFLPSVVGGDIVKIGVALRGARSGSGLVFGSLTDRILDVAGFILIASAGAILSPHLLDPASRRVFSAVAIAVGLSLAGCIAVLMLVPVRRLSFGIRRKLAKVRRAFNATAAQPRIIALALVLGILLQLLLLGLNYWLGVVIGISLPLYVWLFAWPLAKLSALLPVSQGGIGVREAALAFLLAPFGVSAAKAAAAGLIFQTVVISGGLISGLLVTALGGGLRQRVHSAAIDNAR